MAAAPTLPEQLVALDFTSRAVDVLREADEVQLDEASVSIPRAIEFPTEGGLTAHAHFYAPANPEAAAPAETARR